MKLSKRLQTTAQMVPHHCRLADIGADRGELSYALLERKQVEHIILSDISPRSLQRAKILFQDAPFASHAAFRVGSGLTVLAPSEVDCAVLAGMGGDTVIGIFEEAPTVASALKTIIVQAMGNSHKVRRYFMNHHFTITAEAMVEEGGKCYTILKAEPGEMLWTEQELFGGKYLMAEKNPVLKQCLAKEIHDDKEVLSLLREKKQGQKRQEELQAKIAFYQEIEEVIK